MSTDEIMDRHPHDITDAADIELQPDENTAATLDMDKLRAAAAELGYWSGSTDDEHLEKLRTQDARFEKMNRHDPDGIKWSKMGNSPLD
jgi:hypothetical protein